MIGRFRAYLILGVAVLTPVRLALSQRSESAGERPPQLICAPAADSLASLEGSVLDDSTGRPLSWAGVSFPNLNVRRAADSTGHFSFGHVAYGPYTVVIGKLGYRARLDTLVIPPKRACKLTVTLRAFPAETLRSH